MEDFINDFVTQLLENEGKTQKPKKKKKSTVQPSATAPTSKPAAVSTTSIKETKYVTVEQWKALGCPVFGYTTAKIKQYSSKNKEYYETLLHYYRCAVTFLKLTKTIGWYETADEKELILCRKEIKKWQEDNDINEYDLRHVIDICYEYEYNRKTVTKALMKVAQTVLDIYRAEFDKQIGLNPGVKSLVKQRNELTLKNIAKVPPNIRPTLHFVKSEVPVEDEEQSEVTEFMQKIMNTPVSCEACIAHPLYKGLRRPRNDCAECQKYYEFNQSKGVKEKRVRA